MESDFFVYKVESYEKFPTMKFLKYAFFGAIVFFALTWCVQLLFPQVLELPVGKFIGTAIGGFIGGFVSLK